MGLAACGGGGGSGSTPPVTNPPIPTPPGIGGPQVVNPLNLTAAEDFSTFSFDTFNAADRASDQALVDSQISGVARYTGAMVARTGTESEFLRADLRLRVGFQAGTVSGTMDTIQFFGDDSPNRSDTPALDQLLISNGTVTGNELTADVDGTFDEGGFLSLSPPIDQHTVDATMSIVFVDTSKVDRSTELVGTIDGTIESTRDGTRQMEGFVVAESGL